MSDGRLPVRRRWIGWTITIAATLLVLAVGWVVIRGIGAVHALQQVASQAQQLRTAISEGDLGRTQAAAPRIAEQAATARDLTGDPVWRAFEFVPWLGPNFTAVREVAEIADDVADDAVTPVMAAADDIDLSTFGFDGSRLDLEAFAAVRGPLSGASAALTDAETRALAIDAGATLPALEDAIGELRDAVTEAATVVGSLHGAAELLPSMLGAEEPRLYIVAMQNNAESRSEGGIVGAFALVRAEDGRITIVRHASTRDFPPLDESLPVSDAVAALFEDRTGRYIQNATSAPEFPEAAGLIAERWRMQFGQEVDGVLAVDTVVAQHLLAASGPVSFGGFTADADTIIDVLLSEVYAAIPDPATQDAVFAQASTALFGAALGDVEPRALVGALADAAGEGRVRIWSAHEEEQRILADSTLAGTLPTDDENGVHVGVLFNDTTGGKMDYYTDAAISTAIGACRGEPTTQVRVTWTNTAPADAAETLPPYVTADGAYDVTPGSVRTLITVYGPEGALLAGATRDGADDAVQTARLADRSAVQHTVELAPGESTTIVVTFTGEGAGKRLTHVEHTPLIDAPEIGHDELVCAP